MTAFRDGAAPLLNAKCHAGHAVVVTADLADFYDTIRLPDVVALFESLGAPRQVALTLARVSTLDECLIQGGRASPFIANLVASRLDKVIRAGISDRCTYTRYVDDLAFSGDEGYVPTADELEGWISSAKFALRKGSFSLKKRAAGPFVTGLNVSTGDPKAPRELRRRIERFLRFAEIFDIESAARKTFKRGLKASQGDAALGYVHGVATWLRPIDPELSKNWSERVHKLMSRQSDELL